MRQTALFFFLLMIASAGIARAEDIVGKWEGKSPEGDTISYEFKADNTVIWHVDKPAFPKPITARYTIDYSTKPAKLDIFDFSYEPMRKGRIYGIVEFVSPTKIKINAAAGPPDSTKARPTSFNRDTIEFNKVE